MFRGIGTGHRSIHPKMGDTLLDMIEGCVSDHTLRRYHILSESSKSSPFLWHIEVHANVHKFGSGIAQHIAIPVNIMK